jgi:hypothetical protein
MTAPGLTAALLLPLAAPAGAQPTIGIGAAATVTNPFQKQAGGGEP